MMTPLAMFGLGVPELLIILAVVLLLFGGSRLAGLGKSTGRALKEFKEETKGLKPEDKAAPGPTATQPYTEPQAYPQQQSYPQTQPPALGQQPSPGDAQWQQQPPAGGTVNPTESDLRKDV